MARKLGLYDDDKEDSFPETLANSEQVGVTKDQAKATQPAGVTEDQAEATQPAWVTENRAEPTDLAGATENQAEPTQPAGVTLSDGKNTHPVRPIATPARTPTLYHLRSNQDAQAYASEADSQTPSTHRPLLPDYASDDEMTPTEPESPMTPGESMAP